MRRRATRARHILLGRTATVQQYRGRSPVPVQMALPARVIPSGESARRLLRQTGRGKGPGPRYRPKKGRREYKAALRSTQGLGSPHRARPETGAGAGRGRPAQRQRAPRHDAADHPRPAVRVTRYLLACASLDAGVSLDRRQHPCGPLLLERDSMKHRLVLDDVRRRTRVGVLSFDLPLRGLPLMRQVCQP